MTSLDYNPPPGSQRAILDRLESNPESVSVLPDSHLVALTNGKLPPRFVESSNGQPRPCEFVFAEILVRLWLYKSPEENLQLAKDAWVHNFDMGPLEKEFHDRFDGLREAAKLRLGNLSDILEYDPPRHDLESCWKYACKRVAAFAGCHGIIPVVWEGLKEAVAVPFIIRTEAKTELFRDWDGREIRGWITKADELWKTLGYRHGVSLECAFGHCAGSNALGQLSVKGGSFGLPILLAACQLRDDAYAPLDVLCTGEFEDHKLNAVDGIEAKTALARKLGVKLFFASTTTNMQENIGKGQHITLPHGTLDKKEALHSVLKHLGVGDADIAEKLSALFDPIGSIYDDYIKENRRTFVRRETETDELIKLLLEAVDSGSSVPLLITGEAGCGKSALMATLVDKCRERSLTPFFYFQGKAGATSDPEALNLLARQVALETGFDWNKVINEHDPVNQLTAVLNWTEQYRLDRPILIVDDPDKYLSDLGRAMQECPGAVWVLAGQEHIVEKVRQFTGEVRTFPLNRLLPADVLELVKAAAKAEGLQMPANLASAIAKKSEGLAQYATVVARVWAANPEKFNPDHLPDLDKYYGEILERISKWDGIHEKVWRDLIIPAVATLVAARNAAMLEEEMIFHAVARMCRHCSRDNLKLALAACSAVLRRVETPGGEILWGIHHSSLRSAFPREPTLEAESQEAQKILEGICRAWADPTASLPEKRYAARFLISNLRYLHDDDTIISLAQNDSFADFQRRHAGIDTALDTMAKGITCAFQKRLLKETVVLTVRRALWGQVQYRGIPIRKLREGNEQRALEIVSRIENQDERTLWHLALAADHAVAGRNDQAARILDEQVPKGALYKKLSGANSFCAAALLCLLIEVPTRRFRWGWFLARLSDESKVAAASSMMRIAQYRAAWSMIGSISRKDSRDKARLRAVRELAVENPDLAEMQFARFHSEPNREWAIQEVISAALTRKEWDRAYALLDRLTLSRQRAKAICAIAGELQRGRCARSRVQQALYDAERVIQTIPNLDMKAAAYAECAEALASQGGLLREAQDFLETAEALLRGRSRGTNRIRIAGAYVGLTGQLARISQRFLSFRDMMQRTLKDSLAEIQEAGRGGDETRIRLLQLIAGRGYFFQCKAILDSIENKTAKRRAAGLLEALRIRYNAETGRSERNGPEHRESAGIAAIELVVKAPQDAVNRITDVLTAAKLGRPWSWGEPLIEAAIAQMPETEKDLALFHLNSAQRGIHEKLPEDLQGWHLFNLATAAFECGKTEFGKRILEEVWEPRRQPRTEENQKHLLASVELLETTYELRTPAVLAMAGFFPALWKMRNDDVLYTLALFRRVVEVFARAKRQNELRDIYDFVLKYVNPEVSLLTEEERCYWAGEYASRMAMSLRHAPHLVSWVNELCGVCRSLVANSKNNLTYPDEARRAEALLASRKNVVTGLAVAMRIEGGEQMSKALRDIALEAVERGEYSQLFSICNEMVHDQSEHVADVFVQMATKLRSEHLETKDPQAVPANSSSIEVLRHLLEACSNYPDAAYRACAALLPLFGHSAGQYQEAKDAIRQVWEVRCRLLEPEIAKAAA